MKITFIESKPDYSKIVERTVDEAVLKDLTAEVNRLFHISAPYTFVLRNGESHLAQGPKWTKISEVSPSLAQKVTALLQNKPSPPAVEIEDASPSSEESEEEAPPLPSSDTEEDAQSQEELPPLKIPPPREGTLFSFLPSPDPERASSQQRGFKVPPPREETLFSFPASSNPQRTSSGSRRRRSSRKFFFNPEAFQQAPFRQKRGSFSRPPVYVYSPPTSSGEESGARGSEVESPKIRIWSEGESENEGKRPIKLPPPPQRGRFAKFEEQYLRKKKPLALTHGEVVASASSGED